MTNIRVYDTEAEKLIELADEAGTTVAEIMEDLIVFAKDNGYFEK